jgi:hypothetical protein
MGYARDWGSKTVSPLHIHPMKTPREPDPEIPMKQGLSKGNGTAPLSAAKMTRLG